MFEKVDKKYVYIKQRHERYFRKYQMELLKTNKQKYNIWDEN